MTKEGKYTPRELQTLRDDGRLPPSQIEILRQGFAISPSHMKTVTRVLAGGDIGGLKPSPRTRGTTGGTRRGRSQGYKYFPDN
jgi:hypothetical protein